MSCRHASWESVLLRIFPNFLVSCAVVIHMVSLLKEISINCIFLFLLRDLSANQLYGGIPDGFADMPNLKYL